MKKINKYLIFSFIVALLTLLITSKNSFLYVFNDWVDANAFFTVGKSMFNKIIPYKDLFEQKGPLLYFIYGLGYLISHKTFHGVFIIEVISFTIFLYYLHKIFNMYFDKKYSFVLLPTIAVPLTISPFFSHGGSCEEFCLPFIIISLYYYLKHFKKEELTKKEIIINGIMAGCVLMMKYTMLGFWIGLCAFISLNYLIKKQYKKLITFCLLFLLGMGIPFITWLIYFLINNGVKEFIDVYFRLNMTSYTNEKNYGIVKKIIEILKYAYKEYKGSKLFYGLIILPLLALFTKEKNKMFRISLVGLIYLTLFFTFFGLKTFVYYNLPIYLLTTIIIVLFIMQILKKHVDKIINKKYTIVFLIVFLIGTLFQTYKFANYKEYIKKKKEDFFQYKYAEYINQYENATLLNMGFLDVGVYTTSGIIPNTRFFEVQNFDYEKFKDNLDEMKKYVENKKIKFIVYAEFDKDEEPPKYIYDNYKQVYKDKYVSEGNNCTAYLFELKDLKKGEK